MFRSYNQADKLSKEDLVNDVDFQEDALTFLMERQGLQENLTSEEVYDRFMEHMRFHNVNEITTLRDLEYAQNANIEGKLRFGSLIDAFDKVDDGISVQGALDYVEGVAKAPSTYIGLMTGGAGKLATTGGIQVAKVGVRKVLGQALKDAAKGAAIEGAIGYGQGLAQEGVRVETELQDQIVGDRAAMNGLMSAGVGGSVNFLASTGVPFLKGRTARASEADELYYMNKLNAAEKANKAVEKSKIVIQKSIVEKGEAPVKKIKTTLNALNPELVQKGRHLKQMSSTSDTLEASLPSEVIDNIAAAGLRIQDKLDLGPNERVTSALQRAMTRGEEELFVDIKQILDEHNLNFDTFSYFYLAEISEAGRVLGTQGRLARELRGVGKLQPIEEGDEFTRISYKFNPKIVDDLLQDIDKLNASGASSVDSKAAKDLLDNRISVGKFFMDLAKDADKLRLGLMTAQPATTMRNNLNGGLRVAVDISTRTFDNLLNARNPFDGTFDITRNMLNPYEAIVTQRIFAENFPELSARLFRQAADLESKHGGDGILATIGKKANFLNTMSDNIFKRAVLSASFNRRISDANLRMTDEIREGLLVNKITRMRNRETALEAVKKAKDDGTLKQLFEENGNLLQKKKVSFHDLLETNQLNKIPDEIIKDSIEDAYEFVYQTSFKGTNFFGKIAKGTIKAHQDMPFIVSSFLPFPRYIANQLKFIYQHAPLIGMMPLDKPVGDVPIGQYIKGKLPKQMTGAMLFMMAYNWRLKQGDTTNWYEFKDNNNNIVDGRPVYGPFGSNVLVADYIIRYQNGSLPPTRTTLMRDTLQATLGTTFRTGLGLAALDNIVEDFPSLFEKDAGGKGVEASAELVANLVNTFLLPASAVRDVYAQFNRDGRGIPETRNGEFNFLDILYQRGTRSLPKNFAGEYSERAKSAFENEELMQINPLEKQLFGFSKRKGKNKLQEEMGRLNLRPFDLYRRDKNAVRDKYVRDALSKEGGEYNLNEKLTEYMESKKYSSIPNTPDGIAIKRDLLDSAADIIVGNAREEADFRIEQEAMDAGASYTFSDRLRWQRLNRIDKRRIDAEYRTVFGGENSVSEDRDKTIIIAGERVNVLSWAINRAKAIRGKKGALD
tara:strand:- start:762 stop:4127 length:3366 start_codon:yes stop_codon:yes gene_type:complete